ncbi:MAG: MGMT family protein [Cyclobacteriaceae bacterium]|nr:MGMT family protein [Cyclobacteriaceae bacterium HetDA_MAG_MS6]
MSEVRIVNIPEKMEKFYGAGKMLHPTLELIEQTLAQVSFGKVITIDMLCKKLARDFETEVTCPMRTGNAIKKIASSSAAETDTIPFWRVLRKDWSLMNLKDPELSMARLQEEGFTLSFGKSDRVIVQVNASQIHHFS